MLLECLSTFLGIDMLNDNPDYFASGGTMTSELCFPLLLKGEISGRMPTNERSAGNRRTGE
jgi:hypothetical protein